MRLRISGPEKDIAGDFMTRTVAESDNLNRLKELGEQEARKFGVTSTDWIAGPATATAGARTWQLDTGKGCILTISDD